MNVAGPAVGSALSLRRHGVGPGRAVLVTLIANALGFLGILVWVPLGLLLLSGAGIDTTLPLLGRFGPPAVEAAVAALVVAMLVVLRILASAAGSGHRMARFLLGRRDDGEQCAFSAPRYRQLLAIVPYNAAGWVMGALALYVVLEAMSPGAAISLDAVVGAAVLAATLGSLAFFAPEGVGVKDGALVALLTHATGLPPPTCVAAALAMRALDPVTKLGLLCALGAAPTAAHVRRLADVVPRLMRGRAVAPRLRTRVALLSAGLLALVMVPSGAGALAHAEREVFADHDERAAVVAQAAAVAHGHSAVVFREGAPRPR